MLAQHRAHAGPGPPRPAVSHADTSTLADPVRAGPQRAPQLTGAGRVAAVPRAQREILRLAGPVVLPPDGAGKAVVGIGPQRRLLGIGAGGPDTVG